MNGAEPPVSDYNQFTMGVSTVTGPTARLGFVPFLSPYDVYTDFISYPVASTVTISGTITLTMYAYESNAKANATIGIILQRVNNRSEVVSTILDSLAPTELGTAIDGFITWTATPTTTTLQKGDRIRLIPYADDAPGLSMVAGYGVSFAFGAGRNNINYGGPSKVDFTENFSFAYPLNVNISHCGIYTGVRDIPSRTYNANGIRYHFVPELNWMICAPPDDDWILRCTSTDRTQWRSSDIMISNTGGASAAWAAYSGVHSLHFATAFAGFGNNASSSILTSSDAVTWTSRNTGTGSNQLSASNFAYSPTLNLYVCRGQYGATTRSSTGTSWTAGATQDASYTAYAFGPGRTIWAGDAFLSFMNDPTIQPQRSTDGINWTVENWGSLEPNYNWISVIYVPSWQLTVYSTSQGKIYTRPHGASPAWTLRYDGSYGSGGGEVGGVYNFIWNSTTQKLIGVCDFAVIESSDGITWTRMSGFTSQLSGESIRYIYGYDPQLDRYFGSIYQDESYHTNRSSGLVYCNFDWTNKRFRPTNTASSIVDQGSGIKELKLVPQSIT